MAEVHDYIPDDPSGQRWLARQHDDPADPRSQLRVGVDMGDPSTARGIDPASEWFHEMPAPRQAQVVVGGMDKIIEIMRASDRVRTRLLRRDLRWIDGMLKAAGFEILLVRNAREND